MAQRSTQRTDPSQPPDYRTYSAEVTGLHRNLPHHRRLRPHRRFAIIQQHPRVCQGYFQIFSAELCQFSRVFRLFSLGTLLRQYLSAPDGPGLRRRMFSGHAVGEGLAIPVFRFAVICLRRYRGGSQTRPLFFGMASFHAERNPSETWREGQAPPLRHNRKNILSQRAGVAYPPVHGPPPSSVVARTARSSSRPSAS